jgi:predicted SprT family Zn-dependent metalloprotease
MILDMQPIKKIYTILCHAITHMFISSFNPKKMEWLLLFSQVFYLESKDIMNLE